MQSNGAPQKKTTTKKTTTACTTAKKATAKKTVPPARKTVPPAKKTTAPKPRLETTARAEPAPTTLPTPAAADDSATVEEKFLEFLAARRRRRQLLALKVACWVLTAGFLTSLGLAIWQLTIPSMLAGVYVGLAGVFATATGICATLYHQRRRNDRNDHDD